MAGGSILLFPNVSHAKRKKREICRFFSTKFPFSLTYFNEYYKQKDFRIVDSKLLFNPGLNGNGLDFGIPIAVYHGIHLFTSLTVGAVSHIIGAILRDICHCEN